MVPVHNSKCIRFNNPMDPVSSSHGAVNNGVRAARPPLINDVIVVLGMHRSGTSYLAGSMQAYGMHSGRVFEWSKHNLRGNRENAEIMALNDAVLEFSRASWDKPPTQKLRWTTDQAHERDEIIQSLSQSANGQPIGFKDPRTLLTWAFWSQGIPQPRIVSIVRHPIAVAASLHARNKWPLEQGVALWAEYNVRLLDILLQRPESQILIFDWPQGYLRRKTLKSARELGLATSAEARRQGKAFFSRSLRQQSPSDSSQDAIAGLPNALVLYGELKALAEARAKLNVKNHFPSWNRLYSRILTPRS